MQYPRLYATDRYPPNIVHLGSCGGSFYPGTMRTFAFRRPRDQYYQAGDFDMFYPTNLYHLSDDTGSFFPNSIKRYPTCRPAPRPEVETAIPFMFVTPNRRMPRTSASPASCSQEPSQRSMVDEALNMAKTLLGGLYGSSDEKPAVPREVVEKSPDQLCTKDLVKREKPEKCLPAAEGDSKAIISKRPQWTRSLSVPGFAPEEIKVKVKDDHVHVHAVHAEEKGNSVSQLEMEHTIKLPENVDRERLDCSLKSNGYLQLRAPLFTKLCLEHKDAPIALENKSPEPLKALEGRKTEAIEDKSEKREALENKAKEMDSVTLLTEKLLSDILNTKGDECSQVEIPVQRLVQTLLAEAAHVPEILAETLSELTGGMNTPDTKTEPACEKDTECDNTEGRKSTEEPASEETKGKEAAKEELATEEAKEKEVEKELTKDDTKEKETKELALKEKELDMPDPKNNSSVEMTDTTKPLTEPKETDSTPPTRSSTTDTVQQTSTTRKKGELFCKTVPLAGFSPSNITVNLQGHNITISAQRQAWFEDCAYTEGIERRVELPAHMDPSTVRCMYEDNGNLVITARLKDHKEQVPVEVMSK